MILYVLPKKHQKLQRHPIQKSHVPNSQETCIQFQTVSRLTPHKLTKWKVNFTHTSNNFTSLFNAPFDAKHHSTHRVLNALTQPFFVGENFEKYMQLEYDETQIIDVSTGNDFLYGAYNNTALIGTGA